MRSEGISVYSSPAEVAKAAAALVIYSEYRKKITAPSKIV